MRRNAIIAVVMLLLWLVLILLSFGATDTVDSAPGQPTPSLDCLGYLPLICTAPTPRPTPGPPPPPPTARPTATAGGG